MWYHAAHIISAGQLSWQPTLTYRLIDHLCLSSFIHLLLLSPPKIWLLCLTCLHLKLFVSTALVWASLWRVYYQGVGLPYAGLVCVWVNPSVLKAKFWKYLCSSSGAQCCLSYRVICLFLCLSDLHWYFIEWMFWKVEKSFPISTHQQCTLISSIILNTQIIEIYSNNKLIQLLRKTKGVHFLNKDVTGLETNGDHQKFEEKIYFPVSVSN